MSEKKVLCFDLEISPIIGYSWGTYQQNILEVIEDWHLMSFAAKWLGQKKTHVYALPDFDTYKKDTSNDKELTEKLWELFDQADVVVAHNAVRFDNKKSNTRFILNGMGEPSPFLTIDTLQVARNRFGFTSNRLDSLGEFLGVGRKVETGGKKLWMDCLKGDMKAWKLMKKYNVQDVDLLEQVYLKLRPWMTNHPNVNNSGDVRCPKCNSYNINHRGYKTTAKGVTYRRFQCMDCHGWGRYRNKEKSDLPPIV